MTRPEWETRDDLILTDDHPRTPAIHGNLPPVISALLVEDDARLSALVVEFFARYGVEASSVGDATRALHALEERKFDILLIDLLLPGMDGMALTQCVRARWGTPVIMVTGRGTEGDKIASLELGADDYVVKPFNPRELLARVRSVLRRSLGPAASGPMRFASGGLTIDFDAREVLVDGVARDLTHNEFTLICVLARHAGQVLAREHLLDLMKGREGAEETFDRSIDVHVSRLRAKIERDPRHPRYVKTVRGAGYMIARES